MKDEQLIGFISGAITNPSEIEAIVAWIEASPENRKQYNNLLNSWAISGIVLESCDLNLDYSFSQLKKKKFGLYAILNYLKYAAAIILILACGALIPRVATRMITAPDEIVWTEIKVPCGQNAEITLADSTKVWLNSGSNFRYPNTFNPQNRQVALNGEAFFRVKSDKYHPFHIQTNGMNVRVTGTTFNVEAYDTEKSMAVTLVEGQVELRTQSGKLISKMTPNMLATLNKKNNTLEFKNVDTNFYTSWMEGTISFRHEPLEKIAAKLERWYNVQIIFDQPDIKDIQFSGSVLRNKPIDQIFEVLTFTSGIGYQMETRNNQPNIVHLKHLPMKKN